MKCPECGGSNFAWAQRCDHCGEVLTSTAAHSSDPVGIERQPLAREDVADNRPGPGSVPAATRPPVVMLSLLAINAIVFLSMVLSGVSPFDPAADALLRWGASYGPAVTHGEWWRIGAAMFLHIGVLHLLMNMYVLFVSGAISERLFGSAGFAALYVLCGMAGSVASLWWHPNSIGAGASGAIFGLYGGLFGFLIARRRDVSADALQALGKSGLGFVIANLAIGALNPRIDMAAHVGGLIAGVPLGLALAQPLATPAAYRLFRVAAVTVAGIAAIAGAAAMAPVTDDFPAELKRVGVLEERTNESLKAALAKVGTSMTPDEFTSFVEDTVLPPWHQQRDALGTLRVPDEQRKVLTKLARYMTLRGEAWQLSARAMQKDSAEIGREALSKAEEAAAALHAALPSDATQAGLQAVRTANKEHDVEASVLSSLDEIEKRVAKMFNDGFSSVRAGRMAPRDFANQVNSVIIPLWDLETGRLQQSPWLPRGSDTLNRLRSYLTIKREALLLTADGIEKNDPLLIKRGQAKAAEALQVMRGGKR